MKPLLEQKAVHSKMIIEANEVAAPGIHFNDERIGGA